MIHLQAVRVQYGARFVLDRVDLQIGDRERLAVVGRNGEGKSTLLKVAAGILVPDEGEVVRSRGQDVGMLHQENVVPAGRTLWQEAFAALEPIKALEGRATAALELAAGLPSDDPRHDEALHEAEELLERFRQGGGYEVEATCGRVLSGLGFDEADWQRNTEDFSGGWQVRIALARLILERPRLLLLDEPTNHLDMEAVVWLEGYLAKFSKILLMVSHSQDFLNNVTTHTIHMTEQTLHYYGGNYDSYRITRAEKEEAQMKRYEWEQEQIKHMKEYIARFGHGSAKLAKQAQSKEKTLAKMERSGLVQKVRLLRRAARSAHCARSAPTCDASVRRATARGRARFNTV